MGLKQCCERLDGVSPHQINHFTMELVVTAGSTLVEMVAAGGVLVSPGNQVVNG